MTYSPANFDLAEMKLIGFLSCAEAYSKGEIGLQRWNFMLDDMIALVATGIEAGVEEDKWEIPTS